VETWCSICRLCTAAKRIFMANEDHENGITHLLDVDERKLSILATHHTKRTVCKGEHSSVWRCTSCVEDAMFSESRLC